MRQAVPLSAYPFVSVRIACARCPRRGEYRLARLAARYGPEIALSDLLGCIAGDCAKWSPAHAWSERCGAHYVDLVEGRPGDEPDGRERMARWMPALGRVAHEVGGS